MRQVRVISEEPGRCEIELPPRLWRHRHFYGASWFVGTWIVVGWFFRHEFAEAMKDPRVHPKEVFTLIMCSLIAVVVAVRCLQRTRIREVQGTLEVSQYVLLKTFLIADLNAGKNPPPSLQSKVGR